MLERVWRKENPPTLFEGVWIGATTMENSMEVPQKLKTELPYDPAILLLGIYVDKRYTYSNVHSSTIYNSQDTEAS